MNTQKHCFEVEKRHIKLVPLCICLFLIVLELLLVVFVLLVAIIFDRILVHQYLIMLYICLTAIIGLVLGLSIAIFPTADIIANQFYNRLIDFEMNLLASKTLRKASLKVLIIEGMFLFFKFNGEIFITIS